MGKSWFAGLLVSDMLMEGVCEVIATCYSATIWMRGARQSG